MSDTVFVLGAGFSVNAKIPIQEQIMKNISPHLIAKKYYKNVLELGSAHDGRSHTIAIVTASARGIINTMKVELPEIDQMTVPVVRLERTPTAIVYQTFDANSVLGRPIMDALSPTSVF